MLSESPQGRKAWGAIVNSTRSLLRVRKVDVESGGRWVLANCLWLSLNLSFSQEAAAWIHEVEDLSNEEKQKLMERLEQAVWAFPRALTRHLLSEQEDQEDFARDW